MLKKIFALIFLINTLIFIGCQHKKEKIFIPSIFDREHILSISQRKHFYSLYRAHEKKTSNEIALITTPDFGKYETLFLFAIDFGRKLGVGKKDYDNGIVIAFSKTKKQIFITTGYGTEKVLKDEMVKKIIDSLMTPKFKDSMYFEGLDAGSKAIIEFLERPENKIEKRNK